MKSRLTTVIDKTFSPSITTLSVLIFCWINTMSSGFVRILRKYKGVTLMTTQLQQRLSRILLLSLLSVSLVSCNHAEQRIIAAYKPERLVQVCLSGYSDTSRGLFHETVNKLADWLQEAITVNQDGLQFYAN